MDITQIKHQADIYLQQEDFIAAINLYEKCIELAPNLIDSYWYLGLCWLLQGDETQAESIWLSTFSNENWNLKEEDLREFLEILKKQANQYLSVQKPELSQLIYEAILNWDDSNIQVYDNLAHAVAMQGNLEAAIDYWQTLIEIEPNYIDAYLNQANIWQKLENFELAIECYQKALLIKKEDYLVFYQIGLCYTHLQQWNIAIQYFQQSLEIQPEYLPAYSDLAISLIHLEHFDQGIEYLQKVVQSQPEFLQRLLDISNSGKLLLGNANNAGIKLINLLNFSDIHNKLDLYFHLSQTLSKNYPALAVKLLQQVREIDIDYFDHNLDICLGYSKIILEQNNSEQIRELITILTKIINIHEDENLNYIISQCWLRFGNYEETIFYVNKAIAINHNFAEAYYLLGMILFNIRNIEQAVVNLQKHLQIQPNSSVALVYLGFLFGQKHQIADAINCFQKALEINSSIAGLVDNLIKILTQDVDIFELSQIQSVLPPTGFYESTVIDNYIEIYPEIDVKLNSPKSLENQVHFSFRFGKVVKLPASFIVTIPQGRFWLSDDQTKSAIIINESHFLADISPDFPILQPHHPDKHPSQHSIFKVDKLPPIHSITGKVVVLAGLTNNIYFHWMLDILPRWELLRINNCNFDEIDYFVVDNSLSFQRETLKLLAIPEHKQININKIHHLQATQLIVPSFPGTVAWMPKWTCDFLKQRFLNLENTKLPSSKKRIYITRKLAKSRRVLNEDEILKLLATYGFEEVILESLSVLEQAALFSQAEIIISPHGSGLTNLVFCQPGTKVIELFAPNYVYHCYWWISNLVSLDYYYLLGETLPGWHFHHLIYPQDFSEDIVINVRDLLKLLQICE